MNWPLLIVALVALERLAELVYAQRNTRALLARGAYEVGRGHYPLIVLLHLAWLIAVFLVADKSATPVWFWIAVFLLLQVARYWVLATLGRFWTTRIITMRQRAARHERTLPLPQASQLCGRDRRDRWCCPSPFANIAIAILFSLLNAALLWWRIRIENRALDARK